MKTILGDKTNNLCALPQNPILCPLFCITIIKSWRWRAAENYFWDQNKGIEYLVNACHYYLIKK